ncbi:TM2 domain-containing protein [Streptomyces sp. JJ66]|uniref:TM2 domain-containing protein n=1 Tax=Streptomyces sp. JJ66 TaxID=2803843 RepID=UPI001C564E23|nr:TM2 domain-containing protein [Streptomyces sp. JJ66]MBW1603783.1 TM2 domain-containing protein [Streptomyces sp. JJ66]
MADPNQNPYSKEPGDNPYGQAQPPGGPGPSGPPGYPQQPGPGHASGPGYPQAPPPPAYAVPPGQYTGDPNAPYGYDPYGRPYSEKSKVVAGVLQILIGTLGIGRFYTGHIGIGIAQLFTCGGMGIWALIDGILFLTQNDATDAQGRPLRG